MSVPALTMTEIIDENHDNIKDFGQQFLKLEDVPRLSDFGISSKFGFLSENPLTDLPEYFTPWMDIAKNLQILVKNGQLREVVYKMPLLDHTRLKGFREICLAQVALSFISAGFVWMNGEAHIPKVLPCQLAIPYAGVASYLGIHPSLSHCTSVLHNWKLKDPSKPVELDNMDTIVKVAGGSDEAWFFLVAGGVELACVPGLQAIIHAQQAVARCEMENLKKSLVDMELSLQNMSRTLSRMYERCDPDVFYNGFRPFLAGWDNIAFKNKGYNGLIFEGVSDEPMQWTGGSAAQSSSVPSFDAALGVEHTPQEDKLRQHFREYMPPNHREFINAIANGPSIRTYVQNNKDEELQQAYNRCLTALKEFRSGHIQLVTRYIVIMSNKKHRNRKYANQGKAGTGGTGFMKFLKSLRNATEDTSLNDDDDENLQEETKIRKVNGHISAIKKELSSSR